MIKTETKHAFFLLVVTTVLIFVGCKEKYLPAVDPATVEEIGPYAITRTENLTGLSLTLPFHYYIEDGGEYAVWAPDLVKERSHYDPYRAKGRAKIKTYVLRSYINDPIGHSRSLYVFKNKDSTAVSVEALFEDKSPAVFEEERSAGHYVIYKDKASIVYRSRIGMCYDLHHLYSKKDSTHIVLSDYGTHYGYPFNIDKKGDTIRQIGGMHTTGMHNLKLAKGLLSKKEAEQSLVLDWDLYEKEVRPDYLPDYLKPYTDAVPQIKQTIDSLPPGSVVERSFPETAYIGMVKLKEENKLSAIFTTKTTGEQLAALLKRIDARSYELTENRSHTVNVHFKDSTSLLLSVESPPYYSEPDNIYISVTRTMVNKHRILLYSRTETREMGAFYLSFFKTI